MSAPLVALFPQPPYVSLPVRVVPAISQVGDVSTAEQFELPAGFSGEGAELSFFFPPRSGFGTSQFIFLQPPPQILQGPDRNVSLHFSIVPMVGL